MGDVKAPQPDTGSFAGGEHLFPVRVYIENTDAGGMVYHAEYLRFMERGRTEFLRNLEIMQSALISPQGESMVFAIARLEIDYKAQAKVDDALVVHSKIAKIRAASFEIDQWIMRAEDKVTEARLTVALLKSNGRPCRIPGPMREKLEPMMDQAE